MAQLSARFRAEEIEQLEGAGPAQQSALGPRLDISRNDGDGVGEDECRRSVHQLNEVFCA